MTWHRPCEAGRFSPLSVGRDLQFLLDAIARLLSLVHAGRVKTSTKPHAKSWSWIAGPAGLLV